MGSFGSLVGRSLDLIRCNTDEFISKFEDPAKMAKLAVSDTKEKYCKLKKDSAPIIATADQLRAKLADYEREAKCFHEIALNAYKSGDEEMAKVALKSEQKYTNLANDIRTECEEAEAEANGLKNDLFELLQIIADMEKRAVKVEAQTARASVKKQTQIVKGGFNGATTDKMKRAEEKAEKELAEANALKDLSKAETKDDDLEKELKAKYSSGPATSLDDAFEALKAEAQE